MMGSLGSFMVKWLAFTALLLGVHYYIFATIFSDMELYFPLWTVYLFNAGLVLLVFLIVYYQASKGSTKSYSLFLILTISKMALAIVFLIPLLAGKTENAIPDVVNFFIPYFLFLGFEIFQLNDFFKKQETK